MQVNYLDASGGLGRDSDQSSYQQSDEEVSEEDSDDDEVEFTGEGCGLDSGWEEPTVSLKVVTFGPRFLDLVRQSQPTFFYGRNIKLFCTVQEYYMTVYRIAGNFRWVLFLLRRAPKTKI